MPASAQAQTDRSQAAAEEPQPWRIYAHGGRYPAFLRLARYRVNPRFSKFLLRAVARSQLFHACSQAGRYARERQLG
jgi:hypothetical protein